MKSFQEIRNERKLVQFLVSEFGTMYFQLDLPREKYIILRHLDTDMSIELFPTYKHLYNSIMDWVDNKPDIKQFIFIPDFTEIGIDYFARPFYIYHVSFRDYYDKDRDEFIEPPLIFEEMRTAVSQEIDILQNEEDIICRILRRSLLESTGKTIYDYKMNKFIIVEPKFSLVDLIEWKEKNLI